MCETMFENLEKFKAIISDTTHKMSLQLFDYGGQIIKMYLYD